MTTTFLVFDMKMTGEPSQTFCRNEALELFAERKMDGDDVALLAYSVERADRITRRWREDMTAEATEHAASVFLNDWDVDSQPPGWVYRTEYYDRWLGDTTASRREFNEMREQGVL